MEDTVSPKSGLLDLATFAFQASLTLQSEIESFASFHQRARDLTGELEALCEVVDTLREILNDITKGDFSSLNIPLLRCGNACQQFQEELGKYLLQSGGSRTTFRDWGKLRYLGDDIDSFRRLLSSYTLTITIALNDASLYQSSLSTKSIDSYKALAKANTEDLEERLKSLNEKLETINKPNTTQLKSLQDEKLSTQRCLEICGQFSKHLSEIQPLPEDAAVPIRAESVSKRVPHEELQRYRKSLIDAAEELQQHTKTLLDRIVAKSNNTSTPNDFATDLAVLRGAWETVHRCINTCSQAGDCLKENVSVIYNYSTGDAYQFMASNGKTLHGTNQGFGWKVRQGGGIFDDETAREVSRNMSISGFRLARNEGLFPKNRRSRWPR